MLYAISAGNRITATPDSRAQCPVCKGEVLSKCSEIYVWHWAHLAGADCDKWYEPESEWHRQWKERFPEECREVTVGNHRADLRLHLKQCDGSFIDRVIELQASTPSVEEIREREAFYGEMAWLVRGDHFADRFQVIYSHKLSTHTWVQFNWHHPRPSWSFATKPVFIDFGTPGQLFQLIHMGTRLSNMKERLLDGNGYGKWVPVVALINKDSYRNAYESVDADFERFFNRTIVRFGRYKDQPVANMIANEDYCRWFLSQPDLRSKHTWLTHFILNVKQEATS
jgi:hypothetical protein